MKFIGGIDSSNRRNTKRNRNRNTKRNRNRNTKRNTKRISGGERLESDLQSDLEQDLRAIQATKENDIDKINAWAKKMVTDEIDEINALAEKMVTDEIDKINALAKKKVTAAIEKNKLEKQQILTSAKIWRERVNSKKQLNAQLSKKEVDFINSERCKLAASK